MGNVIFDKVTKSFGKDVVIQPISFEVKDKEFVVLVGPSGCGKSTLLRMIAGLEDVTSGTISISNKVVNALPPKDRDIAIVFQNYALYPHMTAYENMAFGLKVRGFSKEDIHKKVSEAANILEINDLLDRKPKAMSGGQSQRIAIGRAIVRDPQVFLFDEPLSNLDAQLRGHMRVEIAALHKRLNTTMIYVTHDQVEAMTLGERIIVLNKGVIQQIDTPQHIYTKPANKFVASFIGSPRINFLDGVISVSSDGLVFKSNDLELKLRDEERFIRFADQNVTIGVRPEHMHLAANEETDYGVFPAEIYGSELLGHEGHVFFKLNGVAWTAKVKSADMQKAPWTAKLAINEEHLLLFDTSSGLALE